MIESCIKIVKENISSDRVVFGSVRFDLDENILKEIEQTKKNNLSLNFAPSLLTDIRTYILLEQQTGFQSGLTFCTYYQQGNNKKAVIKSTIWLDGQITQQICRDRLQNTQSIRKIIGAHYWLSEQLLQKLPITYRGKKSYLNLLSWALSLLFIALIVILNLNYLTPINPLVILAIIVMFFLFYWVIKHLLIFLLPFFRR